MKWEYQCVVVLTTGPDWFNDAQTTLDKLGGRGWEMCGYHQDNVRAVFWLKRSDHVTAQPNPNEKYGPFVTGLKQQDD